MKYRKEAVHATNPEVFAAGRRKLAFAALAVLAVMLVAGIWLLVHSFQSKQSDVDSPTGGGKIGLVAGTVSLNTQTPDYDWRVNRLRESGDPNHQADIDKAVAKAKAAREL